MGAIYFEHKHRAVRQFPKTVQIAPATVRSTANLLLSRRLETERAAESNEIDLAQGFRTADNVVQVSPHQPRMPSGRS